LRVPILLFGEQRLLDEYVGLATNQIFAPRSSRSDGGNLDIKLLWRTPMNVLGELMAAVIQPVHNSGDPALTSNPRLYSVVRQPILDLHGRVHAYELLFRGDSAPDGVSAFHNLFKTAGRFGLEKPSELKKLTGKLTAFVRCPWEALSEQLAHVLPASLTVLETRPTLEVSPELVSSYRQMKALGFRFALDDFTNEPQRTSLLELVDYITVDFRRTTAEVRRRLLEDLRGKSIMMLAKGVHTRPDYRMAREEGFTLFEGYFFLEQVAMRNRRPPVNQMVRLDILKALQQHPMDLHKVRQLVKRDGPLTYQLLRLVNSPAWGMRQNVASIEVALVAVGENAFRRIATLAIASEFNGDQPAELLCMAILRGRICEVMASKRGLDPFGQYLLGLLSLLPAMQGQPMSEVAPALPLSADILEALLGKGCPERAVLGWLEHFERSDWAACDAAAEADGLDQAELSSAYMDAVVWTEGALHSGA
jgi:EAL and modified HD-GYP domain-containing signal transduction protein